MCCDSSIKHVQGMSVKVIAFAEHDGSACASNGTQHGGLRVKDDWAVLISMFALRRVSCRNTMFVH